MVRLSTPFLAGILASLAAANSNICKQEPFLALEVLAAYPPAQAFCSSKFPLARCTTIKTATVTSTATRTVGTLTLTTATATVTSVGSTSTSITYTASVTDTTTILTLTQTVETAAIETVTTSTTSTFYNAKRDALPTEHLQALAPPPLPSKLQAKLEYFEKRGGAPKRPTTIPNPQAIQFSNLINFATHIISQACSCIETPKPCVTVAATATTPSTLSVEATSDVQATVTTVVTNTIVVSEILSSTSDAEITTTLTQTDSTTTTSSVIATKTALSDCTPGCGTYGDSEKSHNLNIVCGITATFGRQIYRESSATTFLECANACGMFGGSCTAFTYSGETETCTFYIFGFQMSNPIVDSDSGYGEVGC